MSSIREAVAVFEEADRFQAAIDELESSGFDRAEISLLASSDVVAEKFGHMYERVAEIADDVNVPRAAYVSTESIGDAEGGLIGGLFYVGAVTAIGAVVASGGTLMAALAAAALAGGAGGMVGSALALLVGKHHADYLQGQLDRGGILLWVRTRDAAHEVRATEILTRNSGHDVHIHEYAAVEV